MRRKDLFLLGLFAAAVLALLSPALFRAGWALANYGDLYAYHVPLRHLSASAQHAGRWPFWNPYIFCGLPLHANPQSVLFYPVSVLTAVLPLALSFTWDYAFHLLWGGLGIYLLARRERLASASALFLAVFYCFSPFLVYRLTEGIPTLLASLSWAPWAWLALLAGRPGFLAAACGLQFLSGHPQFLILNGGAMLLWSLLQPARARLISRLALEGAGALVLAAVQLVPTCEFMSRSVRQDWPAEFNIAYSLLPRDFLTWLKPNAWGNPLDGTYAGPASVFFESSGVYVGWLGLLVAGWGLLWRSRARRPAGLLIAAGVFLSLGGNNPLWRAALSWGPIASLRTPSRYLLLSLWGLVIAAGAGLRRLSLDFRPDRRAAALLVLALAGELLIWDRGFVRSEDARPFLRPNPAISAAVAGRPLRVMTDPELSNTDKTMLYRAMNVNGYEAFYTRGFPAFAARSEGKAAADASRAYLTKADTPEMRRAGVAYTITRTGALVPAPSPLPLAYLVAETPRAKPGESRPPRAVDVERRFRSVSLTIERPERWLIRGRAPEGPARVEVSIPSYPGWRAWWNGAEVPLEPSGFFQSVAAREPGREFSLRLDFVPASWPFAALASLLGWAVWLGLWRRSLA